MKPKGFTLPIFILLIICCAFRFQHIDSLPGEVLNETNAFRKSNGLGALQLNDELNMIAQQHSENVARGRVGFGHAGFEKRNLMATKNISSIRSFAENVAFGATTGKDAVQMWKNSDGHRRNMLGRFRLIGIGVAKDKRGRVFYTQVFAG